MSMVDKLLEEFERYVADFDIIPSSGGVFEVVADGDLVYSKKATGRHAEYEDVAAPIRAKLA